MNYRHVDEYERSQVDPRWTAGPYDYHEARRGPQLRDGVRAHGPEPIAARVPGERVHRGIAATQHHDFGPSVPERLHEHRIHPHVRLHPGSPRLERLGTPDFAAGTGDGGIVGDVLRLEGKHAYSPPREDPTQRRHDKR